jgi:hypothetical protein
MRVFWILFTQILLALAGVLAYCCWPRYLILPQPRDVASVAYVDGRPVVFWRERSLIGRLAEFDDALSAYLMFDYLKAQKLLEGTEVMLTIDRAADESPYRIVVKLPDDLISGIAQLARLEAGHLTSHVDYTWIGSSELARDLQQTKLFEMAYSEPNGRALDQISPAELRSYLRQFIHFKAATDPRTWKKSAWPLSPVTMAEADRLAGDITIVADFYGLPVDVFLGIGAMENNFLNAPGDLNNAIWKKRVERDDIVLERMRHKVRILNSAIGIWQITRQSLRHAQKLFLADKRDYSLLPDRLRPLKRLDMENLNSGVLTTYAGLLLRDLVDRFDGDLVLATGAYNGTVRHPNLRYAEGVEMVASYARRVIGNTAELNGMAAARTASVREKQSEAFLPEVTIKFQP